MFIIPEVILLYKHNFVTSLAFQRPSLHAPGERMALSLCQVSSYDQMSLREILDVQDQPVSEEQAWALCFQLCSLLSHHSWNQTCLSVVLPAANGVILSRDGSISLSAVNRNGGTHFEMETEEQVVQFVGRLVYWCLDWGLETQVERELNQTLEMLVCQMTKVNLSHSADYSFQPICAISDVCKQRLYNPSQAAQHYKSVCSSLLLHTIELCHYLQIVQQSRESLQKLIIEPDTKLVTEMTTDWVSGWKDLVDELSRGVVLRPLAKTQNVSKCPLPVKTAPFNQLLLDIQCRQYTLRKVQAVGNGQKKQDPHQTLLEFIRSRPKLRPVSERKMELKPKEQTCLHELLMQEIRSTNRWKCLSHNGELTYKSESFPINEETEDTFHVKLTTQRKHSEEALNSGNSCWQDSRFTGLKVCTGKRRTRSFASNRELFKVVNSSKKGSVLTTIVDVKKMHSSYKGDMNNLMCERYKDWRGCSCCAMRSLYFTWHNVCSLCSRVICPGCCVQMCLPSKWCVKLPLCFFKQIVMKDGEQSQRNFWNERWSWDSAWVPLVLVSCGPSSTSVHSLAMRDWYSQDICVSCQKLLLETCDSVLSSCPTKDTQEI